MRRRAARCGGRQGYSGACGGGTSTRLSIIDATLQGPARHMRGMLPCTEDDGAWSRNSGSGDRAPGSIPKTAGTHRKVVKTVTEPTQEAGEERAVAQERHVAEDHERVGGEVVCARPRRPRRDRHEDAAVLAVRVPCLQLLRQVAPDRAVAGVRIPVLEVRVGIALLGVGHG